MEQSLQLPTIKVYSAEEVQRDKMLHWARLLLICPVLFYSAYKHTGWLRYAMAAIAILATGYNALQVYAQTKKI